VASLQTKLATIKYAYAPRYGIGFNISAAADSSITNGVTAADIYAGPGAVPLPISLPANGVQVCGTGLFTPGSPTCIPYLKGYAQMTYTSKGHTFIGLGGDYEGKNNAYYQPPFAIADLAVRQPFSKIFEVQLSVQNLFNNNSFDYLPAPNLGVPVTADYSTDGKTITQGSYPTYLLPAPTRTLRMQVRVHLGDK
jgi:outer membrane receptor protein involved in Fe transport